MDTFWNRGACSVREIQEAFPTRNRPASCSHRLLEARCRVRLGRQVLQAWIERIPTVILWAEARYTEVANVKTAISIHERLFKQAESMAREMRLSRSGLFAVALEEFINRHHNRQLLAKINEAHDAQQEDSQGKYLRKMRQRHRKLIEGQW